MAQVISLQEYRNTKPYDRAFKWALDNWNDIVDKATVHFGRDDECISISDQIRQACHVPMNVADEIAQSISLSMAIHNNR